jgi:hypothetical protein
LDQKDEDERHSYGVSEKRETQAFDRSVEDF